MSHCWLYFQQPEVVKPDIRFACQLRLASKVKVQFPYCLSVVLRELQSNLLQMLTQSTAEIILDFCDVFCDGHGRDHVSLKEPVQRSKDEI